MQESDIQADLLREYCGSQSQRLTDSMEPAEEKLSVTNATLHDGSIINETILPSPGPSNDHHLDEMESVLRTRHAWSWPMDTDRYRTMRALQPSSPAVLPRTAYFARHIAQRSRNRVLWYGVIALLLSYVSFGTWRHTNTLTPTPAFLDGWSESCLSNWLQRGSPTMVLFGYQQVFTGFHPPWTAIRSAHKAFTKC